MNEKYLPFKSYADLYSKCELIIKLFDDFNLKQRRLFEDNNIKATPLNFGHIINMADLNTDQKLALNKVAGEKFKTVITQTFSIKNEDNCKQLLHEILDLLIILEEYMSNRADVEGDSEHLKPNEEMELQSELLAYIEKIENLIKKNETA